MANERGLIAKARREELSEELREMLGRWYRNAYEDDNLFLTMARANERKVRTNAEGATAVPAAATVSGLTLTAPSLTDMPCRPGETPTRGAGFFTELAQLHAQKRRFTLPTMNQVSPTSMRLS